MTGGVAVRPRRRRGVVVIVIAAVALVIAGAVVWALGLPAALAAMAPRVADGDTTVSIGDASAPVTVQVPAGWVIERPLFQGDIVVVHSPDRVLALEITARAQPRDAAFAAASEGLAGVGETLTETLGSGLEATHATAGDSLVAAVAPVGSLRSATIDARVSGGALETYRPSIGQILDGISVAP